MRITIYLLFFFWLFTFYAKAQNTLSLIQNPSGANQPSGSATVDPAKYEAANAVYQKLVAARGDFRYPAPTFKLSKANVEGAKMDFDDQAITLEEQAYDVCASFGQDRDAALAIILGHELIHFYEKHNWRKSFVRDYQKLNIGSKLSTLQDDIIHETQSDYLGGFLAYSAGYPLFDKGPDLIKGMYTAYHLPDTISIYPSLQDRQALSAFTIKKLGLLIDAFNTANWLTALGEYANARKCYQYVLNNYQSREIYNNVGVTMLLQVLDEDRPRLFYPVELDLSSHASKGSSGFAKVREKLLQAAILQFDAAISLDPDYAPAYLNKACAYALLKDFTRARFYAEIEAAQKAKNPAFAKTGSDVQTLLGVITYENGDSIAARKIFEQEAAKNNISSKRNLEVMSNNELESESNRSSFKSENIDSISLASFAIDPKWDSKLTQRIDAQTELLQYPIPNKNSRVLICRDDSSDETAMTYFHATGPGYMGKTTLGITLGANRKAVEDVYKAPMRRIQTPQGELWVYSRLLFIFDSAGKLIRWVHYKKP